MNPRVAYPVAADLNALLVACGFTAPQIALQDLEAKCLSASSRWEKESGYKPFLAETQDSESTYDAPRGRTLELRGGLVALTKLEVNEIEWIEGEDFRLYPTDAPHFGEPYTEIKFLRCVPIHTDVVITGKRGYTTELSETDFQTILEGAAADLAPILSSANAQTTTPTKGPIKARDSGPVREEYAVETQSSRVKYEPEKWASRFQHEARSYWPILIGL